jgi:GH25 family lysozyme M1 (1,4-beta-N-acetylmuramidase)
MGGKGFTSAEAGRADAMYCLQIISGLSFEFPVFIDLELPSPATKQGNTDACIAFCEMIKSAGYKTGIDASDISGFKDRLDLSRLGAYDLWVACYGSQPQYATNWSIWQYSSDGAVAGINGRVDVNKSRKDYAGGTTEMFVYMGENFAPVFNPDFYAEKYADLKQAFGNDHTMLWQHFTTFGMWEFRQASAEFNPTVYRDRYADLEKAYSDYFPLYYWHYCHFGKKEGRSAI